MSKFSSSSSHSERRSLASQDDASSVLQAIATLLSSVDRTCLPRQAAQLKKVRVAGCEASLCSLAHSHTRTPSPTLQYVKAFGFEAEKALYRTLFQAILSSSDPSLLCSLYQEVGSVFGRPNFVSLLRHSLDQERLPDSRAIEELTSSSAAASAAASESAPSSSGAVVADQRQEEVVKKINDLTRLLSLSPSEKLACILAVGVDPEPLVSCGEVEISRCTSSSPLDLVDHFLLTSLSLSPSHASLLTQVRESLGGESRLPSSSSCVRLPP